MSLTEARKILERNIDLFQGEIAEAIKTAISVLPNQRERPTALERLTTIRGQIRGAKDGFDPFGSKSRDASYVCWRQCIWLKLSQEGYRTLQLARASGFNHSTIIWGIGHVSDYINAGDYMAVSAWEELNDIIQ